MDRDLALRRVEDWAGGGTYPVQVVYGPEGCGKSAWLRQSVELLREPMWNMTEDGFKQLYEQLLGSKPEFEEVWRLTCGNPAMLERLYRANWNVGKVVERLIIESKDISQSFIRKWSSHLKEAVEDPDYLWFNAPEELTKELTEKNLIVYFLPDRGQEFWIDQPPGKDPEIGIKVRGMANTNT